MDNIESNPLYQELDELITKEQLNYFLDECWRLYPRVYKKIHSRAQGVAYRMIELMMDHHPGLFNILMVRALKEK